MEAKLTTARFYADHVLPQARGLLPSATAGAAGMLGISAEQLAL
jgi:hypothetical protein